MENLGGDTLTEIELKDESIEENKVDDDYIMNKDDEKIINEPINRPPKKWKLEGFNIIVFGVVVLSAAVTVALILNILIGNPQLMPHGSIVVDDSFCGEVGLKIMKRDKGNAVDSAVATALCLAVTRPDVASLAGCGSMLVRDRNMQKTYLFDFSCSSPDSLSSNFPSKTKPATLVGLPSFVRGLLTVHQKFGQKQWSDLFAGALKAAVEGFLPNDALLKAAKASQLSNELLTALRSSNGWYKPPNDLITTLRQLVDVGGEYFYGNFTVSSSSKTFFNHFTEFMIQQGVTWSDDELQNYKVQQPDPLRMPFSGFLLESFPTPFIGGPYSLLLLGNLDLKDSEVPINRSALAHGDIKTTALLLHRLLEIDRLVKQDVITLGDPKDSNVGVKVLNAQANFFNMAYRKQLVSQIHDDSVKGKSRKIFDSFLKFTSTGFVTTDSTSLTVVTNLYLGSDFGNGQIVPNTGVHLNSALILFDTSKSSSFNYPAPRKRPLVPTAPVYLSTATKKCGIRMGLAGMPNFGGIFDMAQVITYGALYMNNMTCHQVFSFVPLADPRVHHKASPSSNSNVASHTMAITKSCFNATAAINSNRLQSFDDGGPVHTESTNSYLIKELKRLGHSVQSGQTVWLSRVFLAGWNVYDLVASGDSRTNSYAKTLYTF